MPISLSHYPVPSNHAWGWGMRMAGMTYDTLWVWGQDALYSKCVLCKSSIAFVFSEQPHCGDTEKSPADNSHFLSETVTGCRATSVCNTDCLAGVQCTRSFLENTGFPTTTRRIDTPAIHKAQHCQLLKLLSHNMGHLGLGVTSCPTLMHTQSMNTQWRAFRKVSGSYYFVAHLTEYCLAKYRKDVHTKL